MPFNNCSADVWGHVEREGEKKRTKQERLNPSLTALNRHCQEPSSTSLAIYKKGR
jgi:hypothetical protein